MGFPGEKEDTTDLVGRLRRQQRALADFGLQAFPLTDLDELLQRGAAMVSEGLGIRLTKVLELLPSGDRLRVRAGVNWKPGVVGKLELGAGRESPAGYVLEHGEPMISQDVLHETRFKVPPTLLEHGVRRTGNVVIAGDERPFGVLEVDATEREELDPDDLAFLKNCANLLAVAIQRQRANEALERAANEQTILVQEMMHRVRNLLALVQSLARQTDAKEPAARAFQEAFLGRLHTLSQAETLVFETDRQNLELRELVTRATEPFGGEGMGAIVLDGPALRVPARIARFLALVLHELGTNATKHGALSASGGSVRIQWETEQIDDGRQFRLCWYEAGGPVIEEDPDRTGFGTRLLTTLAAYELNGSARLNHRPGGVVYELVFPLPAP